MGTCFSKKKEPSTSSSINGVKSLSTIPSHQNKSVTSVSIALSNPTQPEELPLKKNKPLQEKQQDPESAKSEQGQVKKEIFFIKHRKSHDERDRNSKIPPFTSQQNLAAEKSDGVSSNESMENNKVSPLAPSTPNVVGVRTSSCTKEEVDAILIQCGRLSRSSSGRAASSSGECRRKYSGSKRSFDFDHCDNNNENDTTTSGESDQRRANTEIREGHRPRHRQLPRRSSPNGRRRTPSRERDQQSNSRERRVSKSPGRRSPSRRSSETSTTSNANGINKPSISKMVSVPATVSSLVMDKSNNGESSGIKRISVKRNVGAASPRSQSPARGNGNQQNQASLSRNNSLRRTEQSPYRRNPLSDIDPNSLAYPQSNNNNACNKMQNKAKIEVEATKKPNVDINESRTNRTSSRVALEKTVINANCKPKEQQEEETNALSSLPDNTIMKNLISSGLDNNLKPQTLTRTRSSRRSRDLDINPEHQSYTSLLLEDIQNFHQKNTQQQQQPPSSISLPACLNKACSILEAVADLNSTTSSNFPGAFSDHYGKKKDPFMESEVAVSNDLMEPSLHKYVTVKRGGSVGRLADMEDQESSGSNSFTVSSGQQQWGISSSSWEPNSADSRDFWSSREECGFSCEEERKKTLSYNKRRECDHEHSSGIGRGRLVVPAATA